MILDTRSIFEGKISASGVEFFFEVLCNFGGFVEELFEKCFSLDGVLRV